METMNRPKSRLSISIILSLILVATLSACGSSKLDVSNVTAIIDTRSPEAFAASHIVGAINITYTTGTFLATASGFSRTGTYYIYGTTATEAGKAKGDMTSLGTKNVTNLGNFQDAQDVLPLGITK
jgi:rhodanese-related sulfurtransferase